MSTDTKMDTTTSKRRKPLPRLGQIEITEKEREQFKREYNERLIYYKAPLKPRVPAEEQQKKLYRAWQKSQSHKARTDPKTGKCAPYKNEPKIVPPPRKRRDPYKVVDKPKRRFYKYGERGYKDTLSKRLADNFEFLPWWKQAVDKEAYKVKWCTTGISRPLVTIQKAVLKPETPESKKERTRQTYMAPVFMSPLRPDIVRWVFAQQNKNRRQPYAVFAGAGHQHSAESWGTGRAVSRIPRVSGGGTSRAGQGAFGNMCRSGRMFAPTKTWRKWHSPTNLNMRRYATVSAIAASSVPALVEARGHRIDQVPELPLVVDNRIEKIEKTKVAVALLKRIGALPDIEKVKASRTIRAGKGKYRNRRYVQRVGPLVVYRHNKGLVRAMRNLPGVELVRVEKLDVIKLAPGGVLGRFIIWTESAFNYLEALWGSWVDPPQLKRKFRLPRPVMTNPDVRRIIHDPAIMSKARPMVKMPKKGRKRLNPYTNFKQMVKLNPYAVTLRRNAILATRRAKYAKKKDKKKIAEKKEWQFRKDLNYKRICTGKIVRMTKEEYYAKKTRGVRRAARTKAILEKIKQNKQKRKEFHFKILKLRRKARELKKENPQEFRKRTIEIDAMVEKFHRPTYHQRREMRANMPKKYSPSQKMWLYKWLQKLGAKPSLCKIMGWEKKVKGGAKGANVSKKPEEAKPFKTYDNDMCMGKEAPLKAIMDANYVQGKAPKKGDNVVVLLWRKSYKNGYKYMPLYSALADEFKGKPLSVVGCCLDRDKNAAAGFLKKYHNGPKGNFTTTFSICEEWAPPNKVKPLSGRPIEQGFLENMMDLHPGMKEIPSIPHMFLINSSGTIVWHQDHSERGATAPDHMEEVKEQVSRLLGGKVLLSLGTKVEAGSSSDEDSSDGDEGDKAAGDMGDFFTGL